MHTEPELRGRLTVNERKLLDRLVSEQGPRLLAYVWRVFGNRHDAEDIVSETFCRAAGHIAALIRSERQDLYLLTIARNICRDRFRRRRPDLMPDEQLRQYADNADDPPTELAADERLGQLRAAVADLPENLREVVVLRLSTDMKFEQIAELLKVPLGTALSRMHSAVRRLREVMVCEDEHETTQ